MVYTDQIWIKTQCRELERQAIGAIKRAGGDPYLVDAVPLPNNFRRLVTDNIVQQEHIPLYPEFWGTFSYTPEYESRAPTRIFNCFMNRVCTTRQSWFYQFVRRNLLWHASVSFLLDARQEPRGKELYEKNFQGYEIFADEHALMRDRVPFCNFSGDLDQIVVDTHISLVIETYFDWPNTIALSEKVFRALQLPRPLLLFAAPGTVDALEQHGFDVYRDIVNHDYDREPNQIQRQVMLLDQLCEWRDRTFTAEQLVAFEARAQRNRDLLAKLREQWPQRLENVIGQLRC